MVPKTAVRSVFVGILSLAAVGWVYLAAEGAAANGKGSDVIRQWGVCQYVNAGRNPFALCKDILYAKYGPASPGLKKIFSMPKEVPPEREADVLPDVGPPEATYPPPAIGILAPTFGLLPDPWTALGFWFTLNVVMVGVVAYRLTRLWPVPPFTATSFEHWLLMVAILLVFPPTFAALRSGQFSLVILALLLIAMDPSLGWLPRGLALGLALGKPGLAPPFVFVPLVRREWKVLFTAILVQAVATSYVVARTGELVEPFRDWLRLAGYFLNGMYTMQDWLNATGAAAAWLGPAASIGLLFVCLAALAFGRRRPMAQLFTLTSMNALFWTYHGDYDFVLLIPVLLPLAGWADHVPARRLKLVGIVLFALLAIGLCPAVMDGSGLAARGMRWITRVIIISLLIWEYVQVYWQRRTERNPPCAVTKIS